MLRTEDGEEIREMLSLLTWMAARPSPLHTATITSARSHQESRGYEESLMRYHAACVAASPYARESLLQPDVSLIAKWLPPDLACGVRCDLCLKYLHSPPDTARAGKLDD